MLVNYQIQTLNSSSVENRWVDPLQEPSVSPADTRWVGQWWLGYIISAVFVLLSLLPLFLFKKEPPSNIVELNSSENSELNEELINQSTTSSQMSFGNSITGKIRYLLEQQRGYRAFSDLPRNLMRQLSNKAFTLVTLTMCCEFTIVVSFLTFMPKYLQEQFSIDSSISALLCGGVLLPGLILFFSKLLFDLTPTGRFTNWLVASFSLKMTKISRILVFDAKLCFAL